MRLALILAAFIAVPLAAQTLEDAEGSQMAAGREDSSEAGLQLWAEGFRSRALEAGVPAATYDRAWREVEYLPDVIRRDRSQNEFTKTIWDYLDTAVSDDRITNGRAALARHADILARIEAEYGVEKEIVAAIWGLESAYGTYRGTTPTLSALVTLAYDGRRAAFFEAQAIEALKILAGDHVAPADMLGSWAGAMGHTQFMPTSWAEFAVDFDGDGKRNIWSDDPTDGLASAANYLRHWGWQKGLPWGVEVRLPEGFDFDQTTERVKKTSAEWAALGIAPVVGTALPETDAASILLPAGASGPAFLITPNFQVIERYNMADAYVVAIGHLGDRLRGSPALSADWPRHWRALTLEERRELQDLLTKVGFDAGGVDGRIGPKTIAAVKAWQKSGGRVPDGYPSPDVLDALRAAGK